MFKKEYQGGSHVEVFSAQGRDPTSQWRLVGSVKRVYDKSLHGYVYVLEGGSSTTASRMQLPKNDRTMLGLAQPCLVLQLSVPQGGRISLEVGVVDGSGSRRRIHLSNSVRELSSSPLHARVPLHNITEAKWLNLCLDLSSLVSGLFKASPFKSLEWLCLGGSCSLRRVFTLKTTPLPGADCDLPKSCLLPQGTEQPLTLVVSYESLTSVGEGEGVEGEREGERPTHLAFGTKVPIPEHILASRKSARSTAMPTARQTAVSAKTSAGKRRDIGELEADGRGLRPHPPAEPIDPATLSIQKKRVELLSGEKQMKTRGQLSNTHSNNVPSTETVITDRAVAESEQMEREEREMAHTLDDDIEEESVVEMLKDVDIERKEEGLSDRRRGQHSDDLDSSETTYLYSSHPKSASNLMQSVAMDTTSRGGRLDDDFISADNHQGSPHSSEDSHNVSRLSDDYDWRQYASRDDDNERGLSLQSRLAGSHHHHPSASIEVDQSLSGSTSMTLSGWTERYREATAQQPLHDSLDTRDMGGTLTPALGNTMTEQPDFPVDPPGNIHSDDQELDLMYDPQLNCFYDPVTNKYYELVQ